MTFSVCYIVMEPFAGTLGAFLVSMLYLQSAKLVGLGVVIAGYPIWKVALGIHIAAWILQFIGHGVFEGELLIKISHLGPIKICSFCNQNMPHFCNQ